MEQINIPLVLSFRYAEVKEFTMYTGSRKGAVISNTSGIRPSDLWTDEIVKKESLYREMMLTFIDDAWLSIFPYNYSFRYRQKNSVIEILDTQYGRWIPFAYGDKNRLVLKLGLTGIDERHTGKKRSLNHDETCWGAFNYAGLPSMSSLKSKHSRIAWCNIHYTFL